MMDWKGMFPDGFHKQEDEWNKTMTGPAQAQFTQTQYPRRYFIIDFGMSFRYDPSNESPYDYGLIGGDKTVPEFLRGEELHNLFKANVYCADNLIRTEFMQVGRISSV